MVYSGDLGFLEEPSFILKANKLIIANSSVSFELEIQWSAMGRSPFNGNATLKDNGFWESEWIALTGYRKGLYKSKVIFKSLTPDVEEPDLLTVKGTWKDENGDTFDFEDYLEQR